MIKNGSIKMDAGDGGREIIQKPIDTFIHDNRSILKEYQKQAYMKDLGGRKRHREVLIEDDDVVDRRSGKSYSDTQVRRMVSKLKGEIQGQNRIRKSESLQVEIRDKL